MRWPLKLGCALLAGALVAGCGTRTVEYTFSSHSKDAAEPDVEDDLVDDLGPPMPPPDELMCIEVTGPESSCSVCFARDGEPIDPGACHYGCKIDRPTETGRCVFCDGAGESRACLRCLQRPGSGDMCQLCAWTGPDGRAIVNCRRCAGDPSAAYDDCNILWARAWTAQKVF